MEDTNQTGGAGAPTGDANNQLTLVETAPTGETGAAASGTTTPAKKRTRTPGLPVKPVAQMTEDERRQYEALSPAKKAVYDAKVLLAEATAKAKAEAGTKSPARTATDPTKPLTPRHSLTRSYADLHIGLIAPPTSGVRASADLAYSVRERGVLENITVRPGAGGLYYILQGERRYDAVRQIVEEVGRLGADKVDAPEEIKAGNIPATIINTPLEEEDAALFSLTTDRMRSLNIVRAGRLIVDERGRGRDDSYLRREVGFKTGEVEKYAALANLPPVVAKGLEEGRVTPSTALAVGKQAEHIRTQIAATYEARLKEDASARLTEGDVEEARQAAAKSVLERDGAALNAAAQSVPDVAQTPAAAPQTVAPATAEATTAETAAAPPATVNP